MNIFERIKKKKENMKNLAYYTDPTYIYSIKLGRSYCQFYKSTKDYVEYRKIEDNGIKSYKIKIELLDEMVIRGDKHPRIKSIMAYNKKEDDYDTEA